jgi:uncharacterized phage-associated protein
MAILYRTYDAKAVANLFLELAWDEGKNIDPLGIQVLVYFAHGWNLAIHGRPLLTQRIEAGENGPVIRDLYEEFGRFGFAPITGLATKLKYGPGSPPEVEVEYPEVTDDPQTVSLLRDVWNAYKRFTSIQLSNMTHDPGSPWSLAFDQHQPVIDDSLLQQYFVSQMNAA